MLAHHHYFGDLLLKEDSKLEGVHVLSLVQKENIIYTSPVLEVRMGMLEFFHRAGMVNLKIGIKLFLDNIPDFSCIFNKTISLACDLIFSAVHNPHPFLIIV